MPTCSYSRLPHRTAVAPDRSTPYLGWREPEWLCWVYYKQSSRNGGARVGPKEYSAMASSAGYRPPSSCRLNRPTAGGPGNRRLGLRRQELMSALLPIGFAADSRWSHLEDHPVDVPHDDRVWPGALWQFCQNLERQRGLAWAWYPPLSEPGAVLPAGATTGGYEAEAARVWGLMARQVLGSEIDGQVLPDCD